VLVRLGLLVVLALVGCKPRGPALAPIAHLYSPEPGERRHAASVLLARVRAGVAGREAIDALLERARAEADPDALERIMAALAESGAPAAEPLWHGYLQTSVHREQRHRAELYRRWLARSGHPIVTADPGWPYGTTGYSEPTLGGTVWIRDAPAPPMFTCEMTTGATVRRFFDVTLVAFDVDARLAARTRAGIWGARVGMFQGSTLSGLRVQNYRVGPTWEAPVEWVRPSISFRVGYFDVSRFTRSPERVESFVHGAELALAIDLWRHAHDHAVFVSTAGSIDLLEEEVLLCGGTLALGGRY
jgi:hypothetical protein